MYIIAWYFIILIIDTSDEISYRMCNNNQFILSLFNFLSIKLNII